MIIDKLGQFLTKLSAELSAERKRWADVTTLGVGLGSFWRLRPRTMEALQCTLHQLAQEAIPFFAVGAGSNLVGSDTDDSVVALDLQECCGAIRQEGSQFVVGAAVPLLRLVRFAAEQGYGGISRLCGIPGQLGGVVRMNAGALGQEISTAVEEIRGFLEGRPWIWRPQATDWGYRQCNLPAGVVLTEIVLRLQKVSSLDEIGLISSELTRRAAVTPRGRSAGSVFRNPTGLFAGELLEKCGCKELVCNHLRVSEQHANWIVHTGAGAASASDCRALFAEMQKRVEARFGLVLESEWKWLP